MTPPPQDARPSASPPAARMLDVAREAGVSAMTVSRALRDPASVSAKTLARINEAVARIGYLPNRVAGSLSSRRGNVVGLVVPSLRNSLFAETIQGVADILGNAHPLMIADGGYTLAGEEQAVAAFLAQRVCGVVLHNTRHSARTRALLRDAGIPCVETGNLVRDPIDMAVGFSNQEAGRAMTAHLIARGYRRIGFVGLPWRENDRAAERLAGYRAALAEAGRAEDAALIHQAAPGLASGGAALAALMALPTPPDAVFLSGDVLAAGALLEAARRGWAVPGQVAIAGSDDGELQSSLTPGVTTLRFPRHEIGRRAATMLLDRLEGRASGRAVLDLGFELVVRASA
ncbi:LacI family DNA-binding transcriptional regulator [Pseudoroseomonas globiformis]|uniref:LacI family DNA-binding transcriptional regulator n=1 Tax=Teichococcus globiformis TaxID=2307229 RepID=A0ABV7G086_9PROT